MLHWRNLQVECEGEFCGTLGEMVDQGDAGVDRIELAEDGSISEWPDYFIADPDEEPDWDTPRVPVMWLGLREALSHTDEPQTRRED